MHENRETSETPAGHADSRPAGEGLGRTARMYVFEESDSGIVPMNHSNQDGRSWAENEEGRPLIKENTRQSNTHPTQSGARVSQGLAGVRQAAREHQETKFTALLHHLTCYCSSHFRISIFSFPTEPRFVYSASEGRFLLLRFQLLNCLGKLLPLIPEIRPQVPVLFDPAKDSFDV